MKKMEDLYRPHLPLIFLPLAVRRFLQGSQYHFAAEATR